MPTIIKYFFQKDDRKTTFPLGSLMNARLFQRFDNTMEQGELARRDDFESEGVVDA